MKRSVKLMAKAPKPRIVSINSLKVLGTSSETTRSVTAKAKTPSLKPSIREISWLRQRNFLSSPILLSISFSRIMLVLLRSRSDRRLNDPLDLNSRVFTITHEPLDQVPAAIKDKRLRNTLIVAQVIIYQFIFGKAHRILNAKLFRIG